MRVECGDDGVDSDAFVPALEMEDDTEGGEKTGGVEVMGGGGERERAANTEGEDKTGGVKDTEGRDETPAEDDTEGGDKIGTVEDTGGGGDLDGGDDTEGEEDEQLPPDLGSAEAAAIAARAGADCGVPSPTERLAAGSLGSSIAAAAARALSATLLSEAQLGVGQLAQALRDMSEQAAAGVHPPYSASAGQPALARNMWDGSIDDCYANGGDAWRDDTPSPASLGRSFHGAAPASLGRSSDGAGRSPHGAAPASLGPSLDAEPAPILRLRLVLALARLGDGSPHSLQQALSLSAEAAERHPSAPAAALVRAQCLLRAGKRAEGVACLSRVREIGRRAVRRGGRAKGGPAPAVQGENESQSNAHSTAKLNAQTTASRPGGKASNRAYFESTEDDGSDDVWAMAVALPMARALRAIEKRQALARDR
jgi:hypothetical protein